MQLLYKCLANEPGSITAALDLALEAFEEPAGICRRPLRTATLLARLLGTT